MRLTASISWKASDSKKFFWI